MTCRLLGKGKEDKIRVDLLRFHPLLCNYSLGMFYHGHGASINNDLPLFAWVSASSCKLVDKFDLIPSKFICFFFFAGG
jgi:hypothetical protein